MIVIRTFNSIFFLLSIILLTNCSHVNHSVKTKKLSDKTVEQLNNVIREDMKEMNLPGVVVAIWIPGEGDYFFAEGTADYEKGIKRVIDDRFRIASITKTFTASVVEELIEEGKIERSDKLSKYYPDFPNADKITIKDLLNMRSGIADFAGEKFLKEYYNNPFMKITADEMIEMSAKKADSFKEPDRETVYCNTNYILLGEIVTKVTGSDIGVEISNRIFKPLNMTESLYPINGILPGKLHGYSWNAEKKKFDDKTSLNPLCAGAAGAVISNVYDLKKYVKAMYDSAKDTPRLKTHPFKGAPNWLQYGEGINNMGAFWGHNGTIFGFSSEMWYLPQKDAVVIINVNRLDLDDHSKSSKIFMDVTRILFPKYISWPKK
jgi:D-alanyl-D-alanine carboxypeptidase